MAAASISANALNGSVNINSTAVMPLTLGASAASPIGGTFQLQSAVPVTTAGNVSGGTVIVIAPFLVNNNSIGAGTSLTMSTNAGVNISGTGTLNAPSLLIGSAAGNVNIVQGQIIGTVTGTANGAYAITSTTSALTVQSLVSNNASVSATSAQALTASGAFSAATTISLQAGANLNVIDGASLTAIGNIQLSGAGSVQIGNAPGAGGAGVTASAGRLAPGYGVVYALLPENSVLNNGSVLVTALGAAADIVIGDNTSLTANGGAGTPAVGGDLQLNAGRNIVTGNNVSLTSWGGNAVLQSDQDITFGAANQLTSIGKLSDGGGTFVSTNGVTFPNYVGGRAGVFAGVPGQVPAVELQKLVDQRSLTNQVVVDPGIVFDQSSPNLNLSQGAYLKVTASGVNQLKFVDPAAGNIYILQGGVALIDPAGNPTVTFNGTTVRAIGPQGSVAPPPVPASPTLTAANTDSNSGSGSGRAGAGLNFFASYLNLGIPTDRVNGSLTLNDDTQSVQPVYLGSNNDAWTVAQGPGEPLLLPGSDGSFIIGAKGSTLRIVADRAVALGSGRIAIFVGLLPLSITTELAGVELPAFSVVILDRTGTDALVVTNLSHTDVTVFTGDSAKPSAMVVAQAEQLVVSKNLVASSQTVLAPISTEIINGLRLTKLKIDRRQIVEKEPLLTGQTSRFPVEEKRVEQLKRQLSSLLHAAPLVASEFSNSTMPLSAENYKAVAFSSALVTAPTLDPTVKTKQIASAEIKHGNAQFSCADNLITLNCGELLVLANKLTNVKIGAQVVSIGNNAIAWISNEGGLVKVRNLYERSQQSVRHQLGSGTVIGIPAGSEIMNSKSDLQLSDAIVHDSIGRRKIRRLTLPDAGETSICEISLLSIFKASPLLTNLYCSERRQDRDWSYRILKMAACLQQVTGSHGNYMSANPER